MEFQSLVSSRQAVTEVSRKLGLQKVKPGNRKTVEQSLMGDLRRSCKLGKKVLKTLKTAIDDSSLISDYVASYGRFSAISENIINKLGGDSSVKENLKES